MATTLSTTTYEQVTENSEPGAIICAASSNKVAFYGKVPVAQRAYVASLHTTVVSSTDFAAGQAAVLNEVVNTLIGLGVWATA